jgi:DNA-binding CsgD family transcriptional regulator
VEGAGGESSRHASLTTLDPKSASAYPNWYWPGSGCVQGRRKRPPHQQCQQRLVLSAETDIWRPVGRDVAHAGVYREPMAVADRAERARGAFERRLWGDAFDQLSAAHRAGQLDVEDLERLAVAAYMVGRDDACDDAWVEAHRAWSHGGEAERAARCAFWQALGLFFRGDLAPAMGWVARGGRVLGDSRGESVEQAWLRMLTALPRLFEGDADVYSSFVDAGAIAERFADPDATMFARLCRGYALILQGRVAEGVALLDEVMVAVTADEVAPLLAGIAYCQVIALCQAVFDIRRAREWTEALTRWCHSQPDLVPFRGNCLVHRCEIFQLQGAWTEALESARRARELLAGPPAWDVLGSAYYQLAEIERLRGGLREAEESYRQASLAGRDPEPGMSLLRLVQGRVDLALPTIRRALEETQDPIARSRLLPACVEVMLEAEDVAAARTAADELAEIAAQLDAPYLNALAADAAGAVLLAEGDARGALARLRKGQRSWGELEVPHQAARVRVLIGVACRELGDDASAELEFEAARSMLEELGARPDLERLARIAGSPRPGGLSRRESEVLALVAAGKTNRAIATELFISEKTVARHVSNIFAKLGLSSRAEATAYAYKHGLVR